jgi:hypothetical protein
LRYVSLYSQGKDVQLRPFDHLVSAAEAGALVRTISPNHVSFCDFVRLRRVQQRLLTCS